jgi:hypothetical protein
MEYREGLLETVRISLQVRQQGLQLGQRGIVIRPRKES